MKEMLRITAVLTFVCVVCAFFLSFIYSVAEERISLNAKQAVEEALNNITGNVAVVDEIAIEGQIIYKLFDNQNNLIGYGFLASGQGYQGKIEILAVIDPSLKKFLGIEIIESIETPGLGAKIREDHFRDQFKQLSVESGIEYTKGTKDADNQVQAITGATISSKVVVTILNKRIETLRKQMEFNGK